MSAPRQPTRAPRRDTSVNALVVEALTTEIERAKADKGFMDELRALTDRDREILDRLAE